MISVLFRQGSHSSIPVLILAPAGTGKTWIVRQVSVRFGSHRMDHTLLLFVEVDADV